MGQIDIVCGGQYGSEAKGHVAGYLAVGRNVMAVRVAGPNAGHSVVAPDGRKWALRQIPVAAVTNPRAQLVIAQGSEIDLDVLDQEILTLEYSGYSIRNRLFIDRSATVIIAADRQHEADVGLRDRIGSTGKGVGAARAARIMRTAPTYGNGGVDTTDLLNDWLAEDGQVVIEGTQGYGLGLHTRYYPQVTSSDCRAVDFCAMAGIAPWQHRVTPWVVLRTYPIRVAGNSGPLRDETTWDALGLEPEYTTVTQKMRRVGQWDPQLAAEAIRANGGRACRVALMQFDYWYPELAGETQPEKLKIEHWDVLRQLDREIGAPIVLVGTGPGSLVDLRDR